MWCVALTDLHQLPQKLQGTGVLRRDVDAHCKRKSFCKESTAGQFLPAAATARCEVARWLMMPAHARCDLSDCQTSEMSLHPPPHLFSLVSTLYATSQAPSRVLTTRDHLAQSAITLIFPPLSWASISPAWTYPSSVPPSFARYRLYSRPYLCSRRLMIGGSLVEVFSVHNSYFLFCTKIHECLLAYP